MHFVKSAVVVAVAAIVPFASHAQTAAPGKPGQAPPAPPPLAAPAPYKALSVTPAPPANDPSFETFRKELADIVSKKDRAALGRLVGRSFFVLTSAGDRADKKKSALDNLAAAVDLDTADGSGWEVLEGASGDATLEGIEVRKGVRVQCSPATPAFDTKAFEQVLKATRTSPFEWGFTRAEVKVRAAQAEDAAVTDTLGPILVRVFPDQTTEPSPATAANRSATPPAASASPPTIAPPTTLRVVTPAGKTGYVPPDAVLPVMFDRLCYTKDAAGWKITGYLVDD